MKKVMAGASVVVGALAALLFTAALSGQTAGLTEADWVKLRQGKLVKSTKREGGTQSMGSGIGLFNYPPDLMWKVICSLELYDEYVDRTTVSVLLDEAAKDRVVAAGDKTADDVEKLFTGMKPGYVKRAPDGKWTVYSYQRNSFPWPANDRWVLLEITHDDASKTQTWRRLVGNIKQDFGSWHVEPAPDDPGKSLGFVEIHVDLALPATGPFTAFAMDVTLPDTYKCFIDVAKDMQANKTRKSK